MSVTPGPVVSVLMVTYNVRDYALRCLASLPAAFPQTSWEAIVVDNCSRDGTSRAVRAQHSHVTVIDSPRNDGFGAGLNRAAAAAGGRYFFVLNPDCEVSAGAGAELARVLDQYPVIAAVGPAVLNEDRSEQPTRRRFPTLATGLVESTPLQPCFESSRTLRRYYVRDRAGDEAQRVDWLVGAAFMTRREVWERLGGFDEAFFLYFEETDWFRRLAAAGLGEVWFHPGASVVHAGGKSAEQDPGRRHIAFQDSKCRYYGKHHGRLAGTFMRVYLLWWSLWELAVETAKYLLGHRRGLRRTRIRRLAAALRSGLHAS